jgi:hypothetical protein
MKSIIHHIIAVLCITSAAAFAQQGGLPSRYDRANARKLTEDETRNFGPKSGKYRYDARMIRAAEIAADRARESSSNYCWRYVKRALVAADVVDSYPDTRLAKQAAVELPNEYGFKKLNVTNPYKAPIGAVLVYGGSGAGHVEIRTRKGFVSDYFSPTPRANRPFLGAYVLPKGG